MVIKELMHLYFGPSGGGIYATDNPITLENHMQEMFAASADIQSHQVKAEKEALWMAIAVITPDKAREQFRQDVAAGNMPVANVASILHIPVHTTKALLSNQFYHEISSIME